MENNRLYIDKGTVAALFVTLLLTTVLAVSTTAYLLLIYIPSQEPKSLIKESGSLETYSQTSQVIQSTKSEVLKSDQANSGKVKLENVSIAKLANQFVGARETDRDLTHIIRVWSKSTALVSCVFQGLTNAEFNQTGSGMLFKDKAGDLHIWTNKHVAMGGTNGELPTHCTLSFLDGQQYILGAESLVFTGTNNGVDFIRLSLFSNDNERKKLENLAIKEDSLCLDNSDIGEKIVVLGYPTIGASSGITATEGIISGLEANHYVTSAKIEHGNSGGVAISLKNNCYLGTPTYVKSGTLESLARILKWQAYKSSE